MPAEAGERQAVQFKGALQPAFKKIVMIVDESVRGDYLGINKDQYDNTPFLHSASDVITNFGVGVASANCSGPSRMIMRLGLQPKHLPDLKSIWRQVPSIWQYAHEAGFKTVMIDGFRSLGSSTAI